MSALTVAALLVLASAALAPSSVRAEAESPSARAIEIFNNICLSTNAVRADVLQRLEPEGWTPSTYGSLPTTDNSRRGPDIVNLVGVEPEETQVFTRIVAGKTVFVHVRRADEPFALQHATS